VPHLTCVHHGAGKLPKPVMIDSKVRDNKGKPIHRYLLLKYLANWHTAEAICQYHYGLHLAAIHDIGEMWRVNNRCFAQMNDMCWVGANDLQRRGIFRWTDGSSWDWAFWQQNGGVSVTRKDRCVALQV
jgi:Lectin C-type domain